ncbi:MAG: GNAT family N-acetyltransferase [Anaerolineae bacterium]|nr:GNAT family N-acetyltransferase [Anaerolineae bacterium]
MSDTTIRELHGDEMLEIMYRMDAYSFHPSPPLMDRTEWQERARARKEVTCIVLFEDGDPVAMAAASAMTQHVRSATFGMGGVWNVMTHPAARRKGYSRQVMGQLMEAIRQGGQPFSCLYPFRESFYERLGYVSFPQPHRAIISPLSLQSLLEKDLGGVVELTLIDDGFDIYLDYLSVLRQRIHGMAAFEHDDVVSHGGRFWLATARVDGEVVGQMLYNLKGERPTEFTMRAVRFYYHTVQGRYLLLEWIARHADQAERAEIWLPPFERPESWMPDMRLKKETDWFYPMGRVIDVANIGGMQTGPGSFSVHIDDPHCPWNNNVWRFETVDGCLRVSRADKDDGALSIQALTALVYGTHDPDDFAFRGWGDPSAEVKETMRSMFSSMAPYLHEWF